MYELISVGENTWYIDCPAKIGVVRVADGMYIIDSGNDKDAGRKVRQIFEREGWTLKGILNTHSHADHVGGNKYLQNNTGCSIFAEPVEASFIEHPILEPVYLFGGFPPSDLRHKFLMAQESSAKPLSDPAFPKDITPVPIPGHYFGQTGFKTADGVFFIADSVCRRETLDKYTVSVIYDVKGALATLDLLEASDAKLFVPSHAAPTEDIRDLSSYNREKIFAVKAFLLEICSGGLTFEEVLQRVFTGFGLIMTFEQYALVGSTIRSYLSWLKEEKLLSASFEDNRLLWRTVDG
ncbi:MAG TPA: MBL fold metallo-hydrolase [Methanocorpusculum sp.]|nr:MBL fold metallo-hydrolase [Candidatus Methanocorpusculum equi]MCQ2358267.1 MBL fold metallo-hydrolase [Methanocorpusculum sp.]HJJ33500.1 MBL fold metallo-hydrolase [Methanocorpusculum sp.]HJJ45146.1 MBL fold metallo-hydrolase [Methanocorpusculum sp.]